MIFFERQTILETDRVKLIPSTLDHVPSLAKLGNNTALWKYYSTEQLDEDSMRRWVQIGLEGRKQQTQYPFTIIEKATGDIIGSSSLMAISLKDARLEIGSTWLGRKYHGTGLNKHCKFLLLSYSFEKLMMQRVELKTDVLNLQSRRAIEKLGAKQDGILRSHMQMHHNRRRDTVYYSILADEWPTIKKNGFPEFPQNP